MNKPKLDAALAALATAARELALMCDRELPDYAPVWHNIAQDATQLLTNVDPGRAGHGHRRGPGHPGGPALPAGGA